MKTTMMTTTITATTTTTTTTATMTPTAEPDGLDVLSPTNNMYFIKLHCLEQIIECEWNILSSILIGIQNLVSHADVYKVVVSS